MDYEETDELLERNGWVLECFSPLEISEKDNPESKATGHAAEIVITSITEEDKSNQCSDDFCVLVKGHGGSHYP